MAWVFLIVNIITLLSNLGIELYKRWKHRDDENVKPINPNDIIQSIDSVEENKDIIQSIDSVEENNDRM